MTYTTTYQSPLGEILLACDEEGITGLWFSQQKYFAAHLSEEHCVKETAFHREAKRWLDIYFSGQEPDFMPPLHPVGTDFQQQVWAELLRIPYGATTTYGQITRTLADKQQKRVSAQAVGGAVGHNPIGIIVPCHRVIGADGSLTGYAGGLEKKEFLLNVELRIKKERAKPYLRK